MARTISKQKLIEMEGEEHKKFHRRLLYIIVIILIFLFGGSTFYYYIENWRYLDAVYFSAYTMTTVGYGDFVPKTDAGKIFTIFYAFAGVGIALYGLSIIATHFVEVREEFWVERLSNIKIRHSKTFFGKLRNFFSFESEKLTTEYNKPARKK